MGFTTMEKLSHKCIGKKCLICIIKGRRKDKFRMIGELASAMYIKSFNFTNRVTPIYLRQVVETPNVINDPKCNKGAKCNNFWP